MTRLEDLGECVKESVSLIKWQKIGFRSMQLAWYWIFFFKCHCHIFLLMTKLKLRTIAQKVCSEDQPPKKFREHEATCLVEMPTGDNDRTDLLSRKVSRPRGMLSSLILAWPLPSNTSDDRNDWTLGSRNCSGDLWHGALANCPLFLFLFFKTWTLNFFVINDEHLWIVRAWEFLCFKTTVSQIDALFYKLPLFLCCVAAYGRTFVTDGCITREHCRQLGKQYRMRLSLCRHDSLLPSRTFCCSRLSSTNLAFFLSWDSGP